MPKALLQVTGAMSGQNNGGNVLVKPLNKRLLLQKETLRESVNELGFFQVEENKGQFDDFYRVLDKSDDCGMMVEKGDLISAEVVTPIGRIDGKLYFVCHENSVIAKIKE